MKLHNICSFHESKEFSFSLAFFFLSFKLIRVTLVSVTQVSGAQFHNTSSSHCIVCSSPKSGLHPSSFITLYTLLYSAPQQSPHCCPWVFFSVWFPPSRPPIHPPRRKNHQSVLISLTPLVITCSQRCFVSIVRKSSSRFQSL